MPYVPLRQHHWSLEDPASARNGMQLSLRTDLAVQYHAVLGGGFADCEPAGSSTTGYECARGIERRIQGSRLFERSVRVGPRWTEYRADELDFAAVCPIGLDAGG
ncbi:hypothetical protein [Nocardia sp. NBC_01009]|uniref:hypothetical protein n=1 Tax=Nocardia sp. NBC_01009 TaxID=2975996 RepID=UPI0038695844|nr:hypothetical protein OHA42_09115 [Nocardia sp. NBC_01009]